MSKLGQWPYKYWNPAQYPALREPATESQLRYIRNLSYEEPKREILRELENLIGCSHQDMTKGQCVFVIQCLLGEKERLRVCECGLEADVEIIFHNHHTKEKQAYWFCTDHAELYHTEIRMVDEGRVNIAPSELFAGENS